MPATSAGMTSQTLYGLLLHIARRIGGVSRLPPMGRAAQDTLAKLSLSIRYPVSSGTRPMAEWLSSSRLLGL
jgi:hypothetical protein